MNGIKQEFLRPPMLGVDQWTHAIIDGRVTWSEKVTVVQAKILNGQGIPILGQTKLESATINLNSSDDPTTSNTS